MFSIFLAKKGFGFGQASAREKWVEVMHAGGAGQGMGGFAVCEKVNFYWTTKNVSGRRGGVDILFFHQFIAMPYTRGCPTQ